MHELGCNFVHLLRSQGDIYFAPIVSMQEELWVWGRWVRHYKATTTRSLLYCRWYLPSASSWKTFCLRKADDDEEPRPVFLFFKGGLSHCRGRKKKTHARPRRLSMALDRISSAMKRVFFLYLDFFQSIRRGGKLFHEWAWRVHRMISCRFFLFLVLVFLMFSPYSLASPIHSPFANEE